ncbi:hypothetical protein HIM_11158 [Hirsutella minnesotensis 3608]|uniref:Uncharacterized protein n=1 Tax=Hirsutella minnesotensis 3608 TaxID=1043627 RepID=A0A0F7ZRE1_9HYPO|nr:hypothetical protein HIM_11158 [Hirsutella minnesotensis 3608]
MAPTVGAKQRKGRHTAHHADFLRKFAQREKEKQTITKPAPLSARQRAALREQLQDVRFLKPDYAAGTKINIARILRKWKLYCNATESGPWMEITSEGTSWEYWRQYKQLYSRVTGRYFDRNDNREVQKVRLAFVLMAIVGVLTKATFPQWHNTVLVSKWKLRPPNIDGKPVLGTDDLLVLQTFNIAYGKRVFPSERHRIQLSGCYLLLAFTGARPAEIVDNEKRRPKDGTYEDLYRPKSLRSEDSAYYESDQPVDDDSRLLQNMLYQETIARGRPKALCYEDVCLSVVRHPQTGMDVLTMAVKFIHHKGVDRPSSSSLVRED